METQLQAGRMKRRYAEKTNMGIVAEALAPSLRQYELDQVQRVTARFSGQQYLSPLPGPPW